MDQATTEKLKQIKTQTETARLFTRSNEKGRGTIGEWQKMTNLLGTSIANIHFLLGLVNQLTPKQVEPVHTRA